MFAVTSSHILRPDGTFGPGGAILIDGNKILDVTDSVPEGCPVFSFGESWLTPGLIESHGHLTELESNEMSGPVTADMDILDIIDPRAENIPPVREAGFTAFCTLPGSSNLFGGIGAAVKLKPAQTAEEILIPSCRPLKMALGANPLMYGSKGQKPHSGMGCAAIVRETFRKAEKYLEKKEKGSLDAEDPAMEHLASALKGERIVKIHCHTALDITTAVRLASEFHLKFTIEHATAGRYIADYLVKNQVRCCVGPLLIQPLKDEMKDLCPENPGILEKAGVSFSLIQDSGWDTLYLPSVAGICVACGLSHAAAMRGLTSEAARNLGLYRQIGSLEPGKDADLAVFDGDPLLNTTRCLATAIDGIFYHLDQSRLPAPPNEAARAYIWKNIASPCKDK